MTSAGSASFKRSIAHESNSPAAERIHFARFAILADPDRGSDYRRLFYSANYDGDLQSHLAELTAITSDMAALWGRCEGYTGVAEFEPFIRARMQDASAYYIAFRSESVASIRNAIALRRQAQALVDAASAAPLPGIEPVPGSLPPGWPGNTRHAFSAIGSAVVDAIEWLTRAFPIVLDAWRAVRQHGLMNVIRAAQRIVASLNRYPLLRFLNQLTHNRMPPQQSPYSSVSLDNCAVPRRSCPAMKCVGRGSADCRPPSGKMSSRRTS